MSAMFSQIPCSTDSKLALNSTIITPDVLMGPKETQVNLALTFGLSFSSIVVLLACATDNQPVSPDIDATVEARVAEALSENATASVNVFRATTPGKISSVNNTAPSAKFQGE